MPINAYYDGDSYYENGSKDNGDGTTTIVREFPLVFERNRFCNPVGRLLGPGGQTAKWLRKKTGCDILINTNNVHYKGTPKVKITAKDQHSKVQQKMEHALSLVCAIADVNNPNNQFMSDYQLFHPEDAANENIQWVPEQFNAVNSGPTPPSHIAPGVDPKEVTKKPEPQANLTQNTPPTAPNALWNTSQASSFTEGIGSFTFHQNPAIPQQAGRSLFNPSFQSGYPNVPTGYPLVQGSRQPGYPQGYGAPLQQAVPSLFNPSFQSGYPNVPTGYPLVQGSRQPGYPQGYGAPLQQAVPSLFNPSFQSGYPNVPTGYAQGQGSRQPGYPQGFGASGASGYSLDPWASLQIHPNAAPFHRTPASQLNFHYGRF